MTPQTLLQTAILPACRLLPGRMDTQAAHAMLLAIALQESWDLQYRAQIRGPAQSFWQFETGGLRGVLDHHASRRHAEALCRDLAYGRQMERDREGHATGDFVLHLHQAVRHNDVLAAGLARLVLWRLPAPLPGRDDPAAAWAQYLEAWRPGKPHEEPWADRYERAWAEVTRV